MDANTARNFVNNLFSEKIEQLLNDTECAVFEGSWNGFSYEQIAENHGYSKEYLSKDVGFHLWQKISKVIGCDIGKKNLKSIITKKLAESKIPLNQELENKETSIEASDELVEKLRNYFEEDVKRKCCQIHTVSLTYYPLNKLLEEIYVPVTLKDPQFERQGETHKETTREEILLRQPHKSRTHADRAQLIEELNCDRETSPEICWEEALLRYHKIKILGVPGAGKTTLAQFIATHYQNVDIKPLILPVFLSLRKYSQATDRLGLKNYVRHTLVSSRISLQEFEILLSYGQLLFVLDGLDEVKGDRLQTILDEISDFFDTYRDVYAVITCRKGFSAAKSLQLNEFRSFELSGFNREQKNKFIIRWFNAAPELTAVERIRYGHHLLEELSDSENQKIANLAEVPLLLHLICLVFRYEGGLPNKRADLYDKVIDLLLKGWNVEFKGHPHAALNDLEVKSIRELLRKLAVRTFTEGKAFDERSLESIFRDSPLSLSEIEVHSGLIRKQGWQASLYCFSHQTLQEYLTAEAFIYSGDYQGLCEHILDERWREIFLLSLQIGDPDNVIMAMKRGLEKIIYSDKSLQSFQICLNQIDTGGKYKSSSVRMFYLEFYFLLHSIDNWTYEFNCFEHAFEIMIYLDPSLLFASIEQINDYMTIIDENDFGDYTITSDAYNLYDMSEEVISKLTSEMRIDYSLISALNLLRKGLPTYGMCDPEYSNIHMLACLIDQLSFIDKYPCNSQQLFLGIPQCQELSQSFDCEQLCLDIFQIQDLSESQDLSQSFNSELYTFFLELEKQSCDDLLVTSELDNMIESRIPYWTYTLEQIIQKYRAGTVQKLTNEQKDMLRDYYSANIFLLNCVRSVEDVSHHVRLKIEESFLTYL